MFLLKSKPEDTERTEPELEMNQHSLPNAVLWDMDGTLIDQTVAIIRCYSEVITELGYNPPKPEHILRSLGGPMASTMALFVEASKLEVSCQRFRSRFPEIMLDGLILLPGARELITLFAQQNIPQAILTNKHGETARTVRTHLGLSEHLPICIGNSDTVWSKPQAELTQYVLDQLNVNAQGAILIGDSPTDIATARNAGMDCYCVATGAHGRNELDAAGAVATYQSLHELYQAFPQGTSAR